MNANLLERQFCRGSNPCRHPKAHNSTIGVIEDKPSVRGNRANSCRNVSNPSETGGRVLRQGNKTSLHIA